MTSLYLCYQSVREPLTQTQVVAYLEGLARAGYRIVLLTFEPRRLAPTEVEAWQERLAAKGIIWYWVRYHKRPTVPATAWDIAVGTAVGLRLARKYNASLLHARSHVPGVMALMIKRLTGAKLLFDIRGFLAEEYVDAGTWPANGLLFRTTKRIERTLVGAADGFVVLTQKAKIVLQQWYPRETAGKPIQVIPCCVDLRQIPREIAIRKQRSETETTIVYVGKLGGWYMAEEMVVFVSVAMDVFPNLRWQVWTQSNPTYLQQIITNYELDGRVSIGHISAELILKELAKAHAGLCFIKPCLSKLASSPTKVGEYLAAGLPVVCSGEIGEVEALLTGAAARKNAPVGVIVREFTEKGCREALSTLLDLLGDPETPQRCRAVVEECLDLERVGWVRYQQVYQSLSRG
jgi:glycosyltransferase involved in cell wall biosynthesis